MWRCGCRGQRWGAGAEPSPRSDGGPLRLAVLPFDNLTGDAGRDYFSDGLTEELITHLGRLQPERLAVIARISSMAYRGSGKSVPEIGRELDADYLLRGSVRAGDEHWRVTARLVDVAGRSQLWAESYDVAPGDVLELQSDLALRVAHALALELLPGETTALARAGTASTAAYEAYLRGRHAWNRFTAEGYREAVERYGTALELDPGYAAAWAGLADAHNLLAVTADVLPMEAFPAARRAAERALELDPVSLSVHSDLGWYLLFADRWEEGLEECRSILEVEDYGWARACLVQAHLGAGRPAAALEAYRDVLAAAGRLQDAPEVTGLAPPRALGVLRRWQLERALDNELMRRRYPLELVYGHAAVGEPDGAFEWLQRAWELRDPWLVFLTVDPRFDPLHGDPRFARWVDRVKK